MVNSHPHKVIRVVYEKQQGDWHLTLMEMSDGVPNLVEIPHFNAASTQPMRQHVAAILDALAAAGLDGGSMDQFSSSSTQEVVIEIQSSRSKLSREEAYAAANNLTVTEAKELLVERDPESCAHQQLMAQGRERLSTEAGQRYWFEHARDRVLSPKLIYAGPEEA